MKNRVIAHLDRVLDEKGTNDIVYEDIQKAIGRAVDDYRRDDEQVADAATIATAQQQLESGEFITLTEWVNELHCANS